MAPFSWIKNFFGISQDVSSQNQKISAIAGYWFSNSDYHLIEQNGEEGTREVQLNSHTVRSHGFTVVRTHMHDWLILILLVVIYIILNITHPFYRFVGKDMMTDLKYPLKPNTIPGWAIPLYAILLPIIIFLCFYVRRKDVYDLHHAILGLLFSFLVTAVITVTIKNVVGRPRPDFFWRCFPDGKDVYDRLENVICHGDKHVIKEGSFTGLGFLSLYLSGKIKVFDRRGHVAKLCIVFLPLLLAALVGISRVDDYWHHWTNVFAGGLLGLVVATICYLQFFPPPYHLEGWGPYAYFRVLEESRLNVEAQNVQVTEAQVANQQEGSNGHGCIELHLGCNPTSILEDVESGTGTGTGTR